MLWLRLGVGFFVNASQIDSVLRPDSAPVERLLKREEARVFDVTGGRPRRSVVVLRSGDLYLSSSRPQTLVGRTVKAKEDTTE